MASEFLCILTRTGGRKRKERSQIIGAFFKYSKIKKSGIFHSSRITEQFMPDISVYSFYIPLDSKLCVCRDTSVWFINLFGMPGYDSPLSHLGYRMILKIPLPKQNGMEKLHFQFLGQIWQIGYIPQNRLYFKIKEVFIWSNKLFLMMPKNKAIGLRYIFFQL